MSDKVNVLLDDIVLEGTKYLPPEPGLVNLIGRNHTFKSAVADLVDNSIDAGATVVLIRFVRHERRLTSLYVADNGSGMDDSTLDQAMTMGATREYEPSDLGHFGIGLKAASLGQAKSVTVLSRVVGGIAVGRRLERNTSSNFQCGIVGTDFARQNIEYDWEHLQLQSGTVVRLDNVASFPQAADPQVTDRWLEENVRTLSSHLGLVFHRLIAANRIRIVIDIVEGEEGIGGAPVVVEPIDPFGYSRSGAAGYPRSLDVSIDGRVIALACHIWPGRSQLPAFRLMGSSPETHQGVYIYRGDRLLQAGGWHGLTHAEKGLQLARISLEIDNCMDLFAMNPEKSVVNPTESFVRRVESADNGEVRLETFLADATKAFKISQQRSRKRPRVIEPGRGFSPGLRKAIALEVEFLAGEEPISVKWSDLADDRFFEVNHADNSVWVNKRYRALLIGDSGSSLNDAPVLKALMYLLLEELFRGAFLGAKDKDNIDMWQNILTAAALAQEKQ
jgi:Histidine kinase-, DNA gyrase B-, and HSP90-like ATPase